MTKTSTCWRCDKPTTSDDACQACRDHLQISYEQAMRLTECSRCARVLDLDTARFVFPDRMMCPPCFGVAMRTASYLLKLMDERGV